MIFLKHQSEVIKKELTAEFIDECSEKTKGFLAGLGTEKRDIIRYSITVEEILLKMSEKDFGIKTVSLTTGYRFSRPFITVEAEGEPCNAFAPGDAERGVYGTGILRNLGLSPDYSYKNRLNKYSFRLRKKSLNPFLLLVIALVSAAVTGFLGMLLPGGVRSFMLENITGPLHSIFLSVLGCIAGPMIFLSVAWGIYGIGDAASFKKIGKKMLFSYIGTVYFFAAFSGVLFVPLFKLNFSAESGGTGNISALVSMLTGIFPKNIVSPFADGNTLQIIFIAFLFGIGMLFLGQKTEVVAQAVEQINYIVQLHIELISRLVPFFIFLAVVEMIWSDTFKSFASAGKMFLVFLGGMLAVVIIMLFYTSLRQQTSALRLFKKNLPTFVIALTTASSAASFGSNMKTCLDEYGIDETVASFGLPLGLVVFKPVTSVSFICVSLFFAELYGIPVNAVWIVTMILSAGILAIATPPIPGGALTTYTVLFSQLGIPAEAVTVALACDAIFDFLATGSDQFLLPLALMNRSGKFGMVNREILSRK